MTERVSEAQKKRMRAWAAEKERIATQLNGTVCRLRDEATRLRDEAR